MFERIFPKRVGLQQTGAGLQQTGAGSQQTGAGSQQTVSQHRFFSNR